MENIKTKSISVIAAIAITVIQFIVAINSTSKILWQVTMVQALVGKGPVIGYTSSGKPIIEGTPVHMVAAYLGLGLGVIIYGTLIYIVLSHFWKKTNNYERIA